MSKITVALAIVSSLGIGGIGGFTLADKLIKQENLEYPIESNECLGLALTVPKATKAEFKHVRTKPDGKKVFRYLPVPENITLEFDLFDLHDRKANFTIGVEDIVDANGIQIGAQTASGIYVVATPIISNLNVLELSASNYRQNTLDSKLPVVLEVYSYSCPGSLLFSKTIEKLAQQYKDRVKFVRLEHVAEDAKGEARRKAFNTHTKLSISEYPTVVLISNGTYRALGKKGPAIPERSELEAVIKREFKLE